MRPPAAGGDDATDSCKTPRQPESMSSHRSILSCASSVPTSTEAASAHAHHAPVLSKTGAMTSHENSRLPRPVTPCAHAQPTCAHGAARRLVVGSSVFRSRDRSRRYFEEIGPSDQSGLEARGPSSALTPRMAFAVVPVDDAGAADGQRCRRSGITERSLKPSSSPCSPQPSRPQSRRSSTSSCRSRRRRSRSCRRCPTPA
jgi:hypothetical protein